MRPNPNQVEDYRDAHPLYIKRLFQVKVASQNARARKLGRLDEVITVAGWKSALERTGGRCASCGSFCYICIDRIQPLSKGGKTLMTIYSRSVGLATARRATRIDWQPQVINMTNTESTSSCTT